MRTTSPILSEGREIRPLTGVRGMAAGLVLWRHFSGLWVPLLPLLGWFSSLALNGQIGVDLFFVLSGFILAYVHESDQVQFNKRSHLKFLWLRLARVYPIHLAVLGLFAVFAFWGNLFAGEHLGSYPLTSLPFQLTMTHAWIVVHTYQWNYPSWSISAEWFAYLLMFPVSVWILKRKLPAANLFLIGYALLCGWVVLLISHRGEEFWRYGAVIRVGLEFLAGSAFYGVFQQRSPIIRFCQKWCTPIICSWLLLLVATRPGYAHWFCGAALLFIPVILLGLTSEKSWVGRVFASPLMLFAGRVSYSLYMSHALSQRLLQIWLPPQNYTDANIAVKLAVVLADIVVIVGLATALYYLVEVPARNFMRRRVRR